MLDALLDELVVGVGELGDARDGVDAVDVGYDLWCGMKRISLGAGCG